MDGYLPVLAAARQGFCAPAVRISEHPEHDELTLEGPPENLVASWSRQLAVWYRATRDADGHTSGAGEREVELCCAGINVYRHARTMLTRPGPRPGRTVRGLSADIGAGVVASVPRRQGAMNLRPSRPDIVTRMFSRSQVPITSSFARMLAGSCWG